MKKIFILAAITISSITCMAQTSKDLKTDTVTKKVNTNFSVGGDFASSYVWRGTYQTGASIQPGMVFSVSNFALSAWGNVDIASIGFKEFDLAAAYTFKGIKVGITDYWWAGEGAYKYFQYRENETAHHFEANLGYTLPFEKFPLSLSWSTMFAGSDDIDGDGSFDYSTFIEASYPFAIKSVALAASLGVTPWKGLYNDGFGVVTVALKASKEVAISQRFSLPVYAQVIANPASEDIFLVLGITI